MAALPVGQVLVSKESQSVGLLRGGCLMSFEVDLQEGHESGQLSPHLLITKNMIQID